MIDNSTTSEPICVYFLVDEGENRTVSREQLWCLPVGGDRFVVDNFPFYARDISMGDEISTEIRDGDWWFSQISRLSRNTTVRALALRPEVQPSLVAKLESFGALTEKMKASPLITLHYLDQESSAGNLNFEESCVRYK